MRCWVYERKNYTIEEKGITLIALVITIIVLIILAGISISILTGEDGLIAKARQGAQNYQNAAIEEQDMLNTIYDGVGTGIASNTGTIYDVSEKQRKIDELQAELDALKADLGDKAATPNKMLKDYQAYVNGELVTGTILNQSGETVVATGIEKSANKANIFVTIPTSAYYDETSKLSVSMNSVLNTIFSKSNGTNATIAGGSNRSNILDITGSLSIIIYNYG